MERDRPRSTLPLLLVLFAVAGAGLACAGGRRPVRPPERPRVIERGIASWYGPNFHGRRTASGERYDMHHMTAAHKTLPFGTIVEVHDLDNDRRVRVRITDRGPFVRGRILDLSYAAAKKLDMIGPGTAHVELLLVSSPGERPIVAARAAGDSQPAVTATAPAADPGAHRNDTGPWTVQVGAFTERERARALRDLLARHYPEAEVRSSDGWNRVQIGTFKKREKAEAIRRELHDLGWDAVVVRLP